MTDEEIAARLGDLMATEVSELRRLSGGASRQTWRFTTPTGDHVLQRQRPGAIQSMAVEAAVLRAASRAGVPVPELVATGEEEFGAGFLVSRAVDGETIARKILRDDEFAAARSALPAQLGAALAALHRVPADAVHGLEEQDQIERFREILDSFRAPHPAFELGFRWLERNRPESYGRTLVHGDFRMGNLIIGPDGLRAVIDWEIAHVGDPMEDLGWLCVRAWRFGSTLPVAGVGSYEQLFDAYESAGGARVDPAAARWWEVLGTLKWGVMCMMQAYSHLSGMARSHELAAIGRRVCENEFDVLSAIAGAQ